MKRPEFVQKRRKARGFLQAEAAGAGRPADGRSATSGAGLAVAPDADAVL
jgi:hypothetical protein